MYSEHPAKKASLANETIYLPNKKMSKDIVDMPQDEFDEGYVDVENIPEDEILWHTLHPQVVLAQWETTLSGLHEDEAVAR